MSVIQEETIAPREFKAVQRLIYDLAGIALADSKQIMVQSRLAKRLREHQLSSYSEYLDLIQKDPNSEEVVQFINALTTNKTDFFRENHHFQFLANTLFPRLKEQGETSGVRKLRIWCSASSTGEEPYSIAMTVRQFFGYHTDWDIRILASDIDTEVLKTASEGVYPNDRFFEAPTSVHKQYFARISKGENPNWSAKPELRELITFRRINLQQDWPINTTFDIIFCRNVMIYFDAPTQRKLVERFHEKLTENGHLIIGHSESLFGLSNHFKSIGETIYQKTSGESTRVRTASSPIVRHPSLPPSTPNTHRSFTAKVTREENLDLDDAMRGDNERVTSSQNPSVAADRKYPIIVGEVRASRRSEWITTLLGSCVATCLYDEVAKVGGMNHFMLPSSETNPQKCASFGVHAMELLINRIMKEGGDRRRLKAKIFGGGNVISFRDHWNIGERNIEFAKGFLTTEGIPIVASHTGGKSGMQIQFHTHSTKVLVRLLDRRSCDSVLVDERQAAIAFDSNPAPQSDITLF